MNQKGVWQDNTVTNTSVSFMGYDQKAQELVVQGALAQEDAQGYTALHNPQRPSTGFIRDVSISRGYRSTSQVDMTSAGTKTFKLRNPSEVDVIASGLVGNGARVAVVNVNDPSKRAIGTIAVNSRGAEKAAWNGTLQVTFDTDFVNLGSGKAWNIIPLDAFNTPGVAWVGNVRITYTGMEQRGTAWHLTGAKIDASSLTGLQIAPERDAFQVIGTNVIDGSLQRKMN
jgi:hypothetical protein